jgi:hypothetical protein
MSFPSRLLTAAAALGIVASFPAAALADGDPASDFLIGTDVFASYAVTLPAPQTDQLKHVVADANKRGYRIKVAVIATRADLGAVTALWLQPQRYAQFLGQELFFIFKGRLLIAMPNGYGIFHHGKPLASERAVLDSLPAPGSDLAAAASVAVQRLARSAGVAVTIPPLKSSANRDRLLIVLIAGAVALIAGLAFVPRRRRKAQG